MPAEICILTFINRQKTELENFKTNFKLKRLPVLDQKIKEILALKTRK